ncbi:hypothetical protein [Streptomyces hoynatensis]|uniref:hypothetical protein n=1 Tax=Streptomyces hoynatensis TaxID=1141874 RepID=UPI001319CAF7|nr:hypothetical protein [Streptomyces hoynatensis]
MSIRIAVAGALLLASGLLHVRGNGPWLSVLGGVLLVAGVLGALLLRGRSGEAAR